MPGNFASFSSQRSPKLFTNPWPNLGSLGNFFLHKMLAELGILLELHNLAVAGWVMSSLGECNPHQKTREGNTWAMGYEEKKITCVYFSLFKIPSSLCLWLSNPDTTWACQNPIGKGPGTGEFLIMNPLGSFRLLFSKAGLETLRFPLNIRRFSLILLGLAAELRDSWKGLKCLAPSQPFPARFYQ